MPEIDIDKVMRKLTKSKKLQNAAYLRAEGVLDRLKEQELMKPIEDHPVSRELEDGPDKSSSRFLPFGNLFSFFGFVRGTTPVHELKKYFKFIVKLRSQSQARIAHYQGRFVYEVPVAVPDQRNIDSANPLTWEKGKGWTEAIEKGLSNFSHYLFRKSEASRSGTGLQAKFAQRSGNFTGTSYLTPIINSFRAALQKIH